MYSLALDIGISEATLRNYLIGKSVTENVYNKIRKAVSMKKSEFEALYRKYKTKDLEILLGVSAPTIYKRIKEFGITPKGQGKGKRRVRKLDIEE